MKNIIISGICHANIVYLKLGANLINYEWIQVFCIILYGMLQLGVYWEKS